ncbi:hypothetical protein PHYSODRAFT_326405 [Phytophthora sojae]|nr:hypothetical protein PHYSODRAFT_326405 [Phytophthora sojae]EGZ25383.1 hypothetical protein PHYSODRAFT_326405 [Phytophthora sojae]|eukprot:XP_009520671.1 hypothetical protein PHYSODRAFT_326405 [Phytophthora sojae]
MANRFRNWWIKPLAIYHTDVRHVMLMDVDDIFVKDPALRDLEPYKETGTTFFYDHGGVHYLKKLFANFKYEQFNERAGQTVMDIMLWFITKERFRFEYSFGDKETFWLSFEMAHAPYGFSPWGVSVVSSWPNRDMKTHPNTLCGSILQYLPDSSADPQVLYVNGKALLDPYPEGVNSGAKTQRNNMFNSLPTHMTPRLPRTQLNMTDAGAVRKEKMYQECLVGLGATPLPESFAGRLLRRRLHFLGAMTGVLGSLELCGTFELPN